MSIEQYNVFKNKFENTKPIRGRSTEVKPIGKRTRDWEQVVKSFIVEDGALDAEGSTAYGAKLHNTDCVMYMPNGDIHVKSDGWNTPLTSEFITRYLPYSMKCYKKYNKLWVDYASQAYPIDSKKPLVLSYNKDKDSYTIENPVVQHQKVIDRDKIKVAREKLTPFRNYAKIMLKLSDGWLSNDLVEQHAEPTKGNRDYWGRRAFKIGNDVMRPYDISGSMAKSTAEKVYNAMCADESEFPKLLCIICSASNSLESRVIRTETEDYNDYQGNPQQRTNQIREFQYNYKTVDNRIDYFIKNACDVYTTKEVPIGKIVTNLL